MDVHSILWRRLDAPGHDACRIARLEKGWKLEGTAVFLAGGEPVRLAYRLDSDLARRTRRGRVRGWVGGEPVEATVERREDGSWLLDGRPVAGLEACVQLDLGFTPATNFLQLARLGLSTGEADELPVAWLDVPPVPLVLLPQRYERRSESSYWYEAPSVGYRGLLEVSPEGLVQRYPGLWVAEGLESA